MTDARTNLLPPRRWNTSCGTWPIRVPTGHGVECEACQRRATAVDSRTLGRYPVCSRLSGHGSRCPGGEELDTTTSTLVAVVCGKGGMIRPGARLDVDRSDSRRTTATR